MSILESVSSPDDLKRVPQADLPELAAEIRELIISTVSRNGGHMASNLGVVELTIALHRLFDSPTDCIIFDISHQAYAHKILTGRAAGFEKIRTSEGYSGYFEPSESPHDVLALGHAGCGPSIALGIAHAKRMRGEEGYVVCVVGDGSLTSGLAYEGLSNIVALNPPNLMVVLNDNGMAISENVGWLAKWRDRWLPRLRDGLELDDDFQTLERVTERLAPKVPFGEFMLSLGRGLKGAMQKAIIPEIGMVWDELGFNYLGPVGGHDIDELLQVVTGARQYSDKVPFLHVLTKKGYGWDPATEEPVRYHQPGPPQRGVRKQLYSEYFAGVLAEEMASDERVVAISAAMLEGTGLVKVKERFPDRVFDVGICEQQAVSMAAGMARAGLRPVVCIYSTFLQRAFDQIMHDVCMNDLPVVFAIDRAGLVGQDGKSHHGLYDLAYMRIPPNMVVAVPRDEVEMGRLLHTALHQDRPFALRFPKGEVSGVRMPEDRRLTPIGTAEVLQEGKGICLAAVGELVHTALAAGETLAREGIEVQVVNVRFIKPVDDALVQELCDNFTDVVVLEEGTSVGGVAAALLEAIARLRGSGPRVHQLAAGDIFPGHGEQDELRRLLGLDEAAVAHKVRTIAEGASDDKPGC